MAVAMALGVREKFEEKNLLESGTEDGRWSGMGEGVGVEEANVGRVELLLFEIVCQVNPSFVTTNRENACRRETEADTQVPIGVRAKGRLESVDCAARISRH